MARGETTGGAGLRGREEGSILVGVMALTTALLILGAALFVLGRGEADLVEYTVDSARAFSLAEAGQERARTYLEELSETDPPTYPGTASFADEVLGNGTYDIAITRVPGAFPWLVEYEVVTTGEIDGTASEVRTRLRQGTFAGYLHFSNLEGSTWFTTGDSLNGCTHCNGHIRIDGDPWFGMKVTSSEASMTIRRGSNPTFEGGYQLSVDPVALPSASAIMAELQTMAASGGLDLPPLSGTQARYEIVLGKDDMPGYLSYRGYTRSGPRYVWSSWADVGLSSLNGVVWSPNAVYLCGTLDGQITIGAAADIHIVDDVIYRGSTPGYGPDPDCDDILGLVSTKNIIVDDTAPNRTDCEIHAHMIALDESFTVQNYNQGALRGDLIVWGGLAQERVGAVGVLGAFGVVKGYTKEYHYDPRLMGVSPPGYPETNQYVTVSWRRA